MFDRLLVDRRPVEGQRFRFILSLSSPTLTTFEKLVVDRLNFVLYYRPQVTRSVVIIPWGPTGVPVTGARCSDVATPCLKSRTSWMDHFSGRVGSTPSFLVLWVGSCVKRTFINDNVYFLLSLQPLTILFDVSFFHVCNV